jgi:hypothetical protein
MIFRDIAVKVIQAVRDSSLTGDAALISYFDRCAKELAGRIDFAALVGEDEITVDAAANNEAMPTDYLRNLHYAYDTDTKAALTILSPQQMWRKYPRMDATGVYAQYCCVRNGYLYVQPAPTANEDITLRYFKEPDAVDSLADTVPSWIPERVQQDVFFHFACRECFTQIEDGIDGGKPNTQYHEAMYRRAFHNLAWEAQASGEEITPGDITA